MDRASLELLLAQGLSLGEIGRRFGKDPNTVGYWVKKHGLTAAHAAKHASRGGLARTQLEALIAEGLSVAGIARRTGFSKTAVKYWLAKYDLRTTAAKRRAAGRAAKRDGRAAPLMTCPVHGLTEFWLEGRGAYRCKRCRWERVADRRRRVKEILVAEAGGRCAVCGYERFVGALQFHHLDPTTKAFSLGANGVTRGIAAMRAEAHKCVLVCANCHAEIEAGLQTIRDPADRVGAGAEPL